MLRSQNDTASQRRFVPLALETRPNDLDTFFNFIEQFVFPGLPYERQEMLTQIAINILETRPNDLNALFNFIGRFVFPNIAPKRRRKFASRIVRIFSSRILGNLKTCINLLYSRVFLSLSPQRKEIIAFEMTISILQAGTYVLHTSLNFAALAFPRLSPEYRETFVIQTIKTILPSILVDLDMCSNLIKSFFFNILSNRNKEEFAIIMIKSILETRPDDLNALLGFTNNAFSFLSLECRRTLADQTIETILPKILGNSELCTLTLHSRIFFSLSIQRKEIIAIQMTRSIFQTRPDNIIVLFHFIEFDIFTTIPSLNREIFANQTIETILPRILGNLKLCTLILCCRFFNNLPPQRKEMIATQMAKSILEARPDNIIVLFHFIESYIFTTIPSLNREIFANQIIEAILPRILGNLKLYARILHSRFFNNLPPQRKEMIATQMAKSTLEARPDNISALFHFIERDIFKTIPSLNREIFANQIIETILPKILGNLDLCSDLIKSFFFHTFISDSDRDFITIQMTRSILQSRLDDIGTLLDFTNNSFSFLSLECRRTLADQTIETILPRILGNSELCILTLHSCILLNLSVQHKEMIAIQMTRSILQSRLDDISALLDFTNNAFSFLSFECRRTLADQTIETILPRILGNSELCTLTLHSCILLSLSVQRKEMIGIRMIRSILKARPCNIRVLFHFIEYDIFKTIPSLNQEIFANQIIETILRGILSNLKLCTLTLHSRIFLSLSAQRKEMIAIQMTRSILQAEPDNIDAFLNFTKHYFVLAQSAKQKEEFAVQAIKIISPRILKNLDACGNLINSTVFYHLSFSYKRRFIVNVISKIKDPNAFVGFVEHAIPFSDEILRSSFACEAIELFLPRILGNLDACINLLQSSVFLNSLTSLDKETFIYTMVLSIQEKKSYTLDELLNFLKCFAFPILDSHQKLTLVSLVSGTVLKERFDDLSALFDFIEHSAFPCLPLKYQKEFIIEIISEVKPNDLGTPFDSIKQVAFPCLHRILSGILSSSNPLENSNACFNFIAHNAQLLSQAQQKDCAEQMFNTIITIRSCIDIVFSFAESPIFDWLADEHKKEFAIQIIEKIKLDDLNECVRLIESPIFKFSSYEKKVQILIQILSHHSSSFFDFSTIYALYSLQLPISDLPSLKATKICEAAGELASDPSPNTPETRVLSQKLLESYGSVFENHDRIPTRFQKKRPIYTPPKFLTEHPKIFVLISMIKDQEQKRRESEDKSKTSELI
ncbi:MAG: hypothetical protein LBJ93_04475 [Clostridiales bacterium]|nr:hypothetical protein [Clostridiales bacterium]